MLKLFCFDIQNNFGTQHVLKMLRASVKDLLVLIAMYLMIERARSSKPFSPSDDMTATKKPLVSTIA